MSHSSSSSSSSSPTTNSLFLPSSNCPSPCPTPRSILRCRAMSSRSNGSSNSSCVRFSECIDEHQADDYDRSKCPSAQPSAREIRELERIRRELLPEGTGISDEPESDEDVTPYFAFDDGGDVDEAPPPRRSVPRGRRLRGVPIELCPILPAAGPSPTPCHSHSPSPLNSPPHGSPTMGPVPMRSFPKRAMMTFLPIYPSQHTTPAQVITPPETPTMDKLDLSEDHHHSNALSSSCGPIPLSTPRPRVPPPCRMSIMPVCAETVHAQAIANTGVTPAAMYSMSYKATAST